MKRNFQVVDGIYLVQLPYKLDLHNNFDFLGFSYSVENRTLLLTWRLSVGEWVAVDTPSSLTIEFRDVSELRFYPRNSDLPFSEDSCLNSFGYWVDEDWADGVVIIDDHEQVDPAWLTAINFMSGAVIAVQSASAHAQIQV